MPTPRRRSLIASKLVLGVGLLALICFASFAPPLIEPPILPPTASGNETPFTNPAGFSITFPPGWRAANHGLPGGYKALTYAHLDKQDNTTPVMRVEIAVDYETNSDISVRDLQPHKTVFLEREATLRAGRISHGLTFWQNVRRVWGNGTLTAWKPGRTYASWTLEFEQAGERFTLPYTAPCGAFALINTTVIPPEVMSYFETFEYNPTMATTCPDSCRSQFVIASIAVIRAAGREKSSMIGSRVKSFAVLPAASVMLTRR